MILWLLPLCLPGQEIQPVQGVEHFVQAGGEKVKIEEALQFMAQFDRAMLARVNEARKLNTLPAISAGAVQTDPNLNREALQTYLTLLRGDYAQAKGKVPTHDQIFLLWLIGDRAFRKIDYDPDRIKDKELRLRLEHFRLLRSPQARNPSPLPTDGRRPMQRRYYQTRAELLTTQHAQPAISSVPPEINLPKPKDRP